MTTVYFIRHAESDYTVRESRIRPLTVKGLTDCRLVTDYLRDKNIGVVLSSPYKRAVDTVSDFAEAYDFKIETIEDFCECNNNDAPAIKEEDFPLDMKKMWTDFSIKFADGECFAEVQERNMDALNEVLMKHKNKNIVIGTHGIALSTIIKYYDISFEYEDFMAMMDLMPWVVKMTFDEKTLKEIEKIDLFMLQS